jgi:hypothetical protein
MQSSACVETIGPFEVELPGKRYLEQVAWSQLVGKVTLVI